MNTVTIVLVALGAAVLFAIVLYNRIIRLQNNREQAFSDIDVQLKQRHDLIPPLVEAVKGYMKHEKGVLTEVTNARSEAMKAKNIDEKIAAETRLGAALSGLTVAVEAYPDLKASQNFMHLQGEISDVENKLAAARRFFNSATKEFNNAVETFPASVVAGMFGFKEEKMFEASEGRAELEKAPEIKI